MHALRFSIACACLVLVACTGGSTPLGQDGGTGGTGSPVPGTSGSGSGSSGTSSGQASSADAFVTTVVGPGSASPVTVCNLTSADAILDIGQPVAGKPLTVSDGDSSGGSQVHVTCSVRAVGAGFDIALSATLEGVNGANLTITSPTGAGAVTANGGSGITGVFQSTNLGTYRQNDCTITFTYNGETVPDSPPIAAGRIWGHISCPAAQDGARQVMEPDGGSTNVQCDAEADFLFEQCSE
jgi:hypothetical protein